MAKQRGIMKLEGTIGGVTFYKSRDGYLAKEKSGVPAERIASDPAFQRTRENGAEFGRAGKGGKVLRNAIRGLLQNARDSRMVSRLTKEMLKVIQFETVNLRGERSLVDAQTETLEGFDFNINAKLGTTLYAPFTAAIDRVTGAQTVNLPAFIPQNMISAPSGASHFKIVSAGTEVNFQDEKFVSVTSATAILPWNSVPTAVINLANALPAASNYHLFLVVGIEFYQEVNGVMYPLKNGAFNPLNLVKVDSGV
jgi:hypothetical protein